MRTSRAALSAGGSRDSFRRRGGFSLSRQAAPSRFSQLTLKILNLLAGPLSERCALHGVPTRRFSLLCEAFALCLFTNLLCRRLFALAP